MKNITHLERNHVLDEGVCIIYRPGSLATAYDTPLSNFDHVVAFCHNPQRAVCSVTKKKKEENQDKLNHLLNLFFVSIELSPCATSEDDNSGNATKKHVRLPVRSRYQRCEISPLFG